MTNRCRQGCPKLLGEDDEIGNWSVYHVCSKNGRRKDSENRTIYDNRVIWWDDQTSREPINIQQPNQEDHEVNGTGSQSILWGNCMKSVIFSYNFTSETQHDLYRPQTDKDVSRFMNRLKHHHQLLPGPWEREDAEWLMKYVWYVVNVAIMNWVW